jgi:glutaconate CoA-transferase subunit B
MSAFTLRELMVVAAAREIEDEQLVFVGMRLPLLSFLLAKATHAPRAIGLYENGVIRTIPSRALLYTMSDLPNIFRATTCGDMLMVMGWLQQGRVGIGLIGGAEIDRYANLNTSYVLDDRGRRVRLPGSGGACDIASLAHRLVIIMAHEKRRFRPRVSYITSPGYGEGGSWRSQVGLPRGGPTAVITDKGVLRVDPETKELVLASIHPGVSQDEVLAHTGWALRLSENLRQTPPPTAGELRIIRALDPDGFWTR